MGFGKWKDKLFYYYLLYRVRPAKLKRAMKKLRPLNGLKGGSKKDGSRGKIKAAALQIEVKLYQDPVDFTSAMAVKVREAVELGAEIIVFPENNIMQLIGFLPGMGQSRGKDNIENKDNDNIPADLDGKFNLADVLRFITPIIKKVVLTTFSELAKAYQVYIMTGTGLIAANDGRIYNIGYLFGPDGKLLGTQRKLHLMPLETEWGIARGQELEVISTEIGKLAFPICMDASYFETFRIARKKGAEIVMIPIANPDPDYNYWAALRGIWPRVQESGVFGMKSAMVGDFLGFTFTGQAGIYAPLELTEKRDGILAEAGSYDQEEIIIAELDLHALNELRKKDKLSADCNFGLWERYFPGIYYSI